MSAVTATGRVDYEKDWNCVGFAKEGFDIFFGNGPLVGTAAGQ
jgi:hypothetical protein